MIKFEDISTRRGPTKVVDAMNLEMWTRQGWKLVFSFQESLLMQCNECEPKMVHNPSSYNSSNDTVMAQRWRPYTTTYFVLVQDEESALAEAAQKIADAEVTRSNAETNERTAREAQAKAEEAKTRAEKEAERQKERADQIWQQMNQAQTQARKLEQDMAKIQNAVGSLKVKEILGETK